MNNFKITALGALATIGLASAAIAQPKVDHQPDRAQGAQQQERGEMQGDMSGMEMSGMMAMMNDPEMVTGGKVDKALENAKGFTEAVYERLR